VRRLSLVAEAGDGKRIATAEWQPDDINPPHK